MGKKKSSTGAAQGGIRQAQAWLHTWCGLWFSWLLFAVFLTGTLAVFEEPITHWMTPEHHAEERAAKARELEPAAPGPSMRQRLAWATAFMERNHPGAGMWELWPANVEGQGNLRVYWFDEKRQYASADLDPANGQPVSVKTAPARKTLGGHHFVDFHYELHAGQIGLWIVGIAAMAMLVALVSGVITHRRIFKDFFTFRPRKGQRSWLDAHNAVAVLTLPFQLMIAYTGIAISGGTFMPAGIATYFGAGEQGTRAFSAALNEPLEPRPSGKAMAVPDLEPFVTQGAALMGQPVRAVVIHHPGDASARVGIYGWNDESGLRRRLSSTSGMVMFSAATGEVLHVRRPGEVEGGMPSLAQSVISGLHMATFGGLTLKWLYFICGLAGSAMMATGAILFAVKRRTRHVGEFGTASTRVYSLIESLNVAAIAGLAAACISFLWANRLIPAGWLHRENWELGAFFLLWLLTLAHALVRAPAIAWREQLGLLAALCLLLPVLNFLTTGEHLPGYIQNGDWESAGVEFFALAMGIASVGVLRSLARQQRREAAGSGQKRRAVSTGQSLTSPSAHKVSEGSAT